MDGLVINISNTVLILDPGVVIEAAAGCFGSLKDPNGTATLLSTRNRGPHACYSISPYVDDHGEEDAGLRRGRPLHLDAERMQTLSKLWAQHAISGEVVHERVMRDRVVREGYY